MTGGALRRRWARGLPPRRELAIAALAGLAAASGQAPLGWWWLALPGYGLLVARVAHAETAANAFWLAWIGAAAHFAAALFWIVEPFLIEPERYAWMAPFALVFMAFGLALFWAAPAVLAARLGQGASARALLFALAMPLAEWLRGWLFTGFPWAEPGQVWVGTPVLQLAALAGPPVLTLLTVLVAAFPTIRSGLPGLAFSALVLALAFGWGHWQLSQPMPAAGTPVQVRLLQPNAPQGEKWQGDRVFQFFERQMAYTGARADPPPDLVVWPETSVPFLLDRDDGGLAMIADEGRGATVALGIQRTEGARIFNSLAVIAPGGAVADVYDKHHLVPFGEYIPLGDLIDDHLSIRAFAAQAGFGYSDGPGARVMNLGPIGKVLPLICYEAVFPRDLRAAPERADWILQVTNDAWFGNLSGPFQHLAQARMRAVEQGLPLLRSANTGVSAIIDARGRIVQSLALNSAGYLDGPVPPALPPTPYARWGDFPPLFLIGTALLLAGLRQRRFRG